MKRVLLSLLLVLTGSLAANALSYNDARERAWFLTDKMAYELNLNPEQYDVVYQVNLEYFLQVNSPSDCTGRYWRYRNTDLRYILFDWQYDLYTTLEYFYRPIRWITSGWRYPIFDRYRIGYYYYSRPKVYVSYTGGLWKNRRPKDKSPFRDVHFRKGPGMRDNYNGKRPSAKPDYRPEYGKPGKDRPTVDRGYNKHGKNDDKRRPNADADKGKKDNNVVRPSNRDNKKVEKPNPNVGRGNSHTSRRATTVARPTTSHKNNATSSRAGATRNASKSSNASSSRTFGR